MIPEELPFHWRFAAGQAFARLRELVRAFDFRALADGHTYVDLPPTDLVKVIDGFLSEDANTVYSGNRTELQGLRQVLVERIMPAYEQGLSAGKCCWETGDRIWQAAGTEKLHELALQLGPADPELNGWFAEGFCVAYSSAWFESQRL